SDFTVSGDGTNSTGRSKRSNVMKTIRSCAQLSKRMAQTKFLSSMVAARDNVRYWAIILLTSLVTITGMALLSLDASVTQLPFQQYTWVSLPWERIPEGAQ